MTQKFYFKLLFDYFALILEMLQLFVKNLPKRDVHQLMHFGAYGVKLNYFMHLFTLVYLRNSELTPMISSAPQVVNHFWVTVCNTVRPVLSDCCLSCLSAVWMYCGQTAGWIKTPFGMEIGLGPGHIALDGDPAPQKGAQQPPIFGPCLLWPNGWMDQDATLYAGRLQLRRHCVRWGPSSPCPPKKGAQHPLTFRPISIVAKRLPISASAELLY